MEKVNHTTPCITSPPHCLAGATSQLLLRASDRSLHHIQLDQQCHHATEAIECCLPSRRLTAFCSSEALCALDEILQVFMLPSDAILEEVTLSKIISSGHSRVPIHQPGNRSAYCCVTDCNIITTCCLGTCYMRMCVQLIACIFCSVYICRLYTHVWLCIYRWMSVCAQLNSKVLAYVHVNGKVLLQYENHASLDRHKVIGLILVKELAMVDKSAHTPVTTLKMRSLPFLRANTPLYDLLRLFETGRCHMAVLTGPSEAKGVLDPPMTPPSLHPSDINPSEALQRHHSDGMHAHLLQRQHSDGPSVHHIMQRQASEGGHSQLISTEPDGLMHDEVHHAHLASLQLQFSLKSCRHIIICITLLLASVGIMSAAGCTSRDSIAFQAEWQHICSNHFNAQCEQCVVWTMP